MLKSPHNSQYKENPLKTNIKVISLAIIFGLLPLAMNTLFSVGDPLEFKIWFQLTIIYTFWFVGLYKLLYSNNHASYLFMALFVTIGLLVATPLGHNKYSLLVIINIAYTVFSVIGVGYLTGKKTEKGQK